MLNKLKELFTSDELLKGNYGIEREGLRVNDKGKLSYDLIQRYLVIRQIIHI